MRIDAIGLRTWLLLACAGWAALACALAAAGMGSRIDADARAEDALPPLPALPPAASDRLGDADRYAGIAARPVFAQDRQPHPFFLSGGGETAAGGLRLTGVLITPQLRMATLTTGDGASLRLRLQGEAVGGWRLLALEPRKATLQGPGGARTLELQVFSGAATPPAATTPAAQGAAAPPASTAPPAAATQAASTEAPPRPSDEQLKAIRERIEARRRELRERQQNGAASGKQP